MTLSSWWIEACHATIVSGVASVRQGLEVEVGSAFRRAESTPTVKGILATALVAVLAGCGSRAAAPAAPTTHVLRAKASPRAAANPADVRFARLVVVDDREDLSADQLGNRKSASAALSGAAVRRANEQTSELALATRFLARENVRAASPTHAQRRAWASRYEGLVDVAGWRFDDAFTTAIESRDRVELAAAADELRAGTSDAARSLARRVERQRTEEIATLRTISA
jgi:uncharacterized protein (DUF305 family)